MPASVEICCMGRRQSHVLTKLLLKGACWGGLVGGPWEKDTRINPSLMVQLLALYLKEQTQLTDVFVWVLSWHDWLHLM